MGSLTDALIPGALFLIGVYAAYKVGYGSAMRDVGRTILDIREESDELISSARARLARLEAGPFDWDDAPEVLTVEDFDRTILKLAADPPAPLLTLAARRRVELYEQGQQRPDDAA